MLDEKDFINEIWNKYDKYKYKRNTKKDFFKKHHYKNSEYILTIKSFIIFIISILATTGIVYAGITTYKFIQKSTSTDFNKHQGYDYNQNMLYNNGMYYKIINNYEEYQEIQKIWDNLVDMQINDFKDNFMIILVGENYNTTGLYISDIYTKYEKLCIELRKKDVWSEKDTVISTKISKEFYSDNIEILNLPNEVNTDGKYKNIEDITPDYTMEEAISDNCFVINEKEQIVSNDKERLNEFIDNCNNQINDLIRICTYENNGITIYDIEYNKNKLNMTVKRSVEKSNFITYNYTGTGISVLKRPATAGGGYSYSLYDEIGNKCLICFVSD